MSHLTLKSNPLVAHIKLQQDVGNWKDETIVVPIFIRLSLASPLPPTLPWHTNIILLVGACISPIYLANRPAAVVPTAHTHMMHLLTCRSSYTVHVKRVSLAGYDKSFFFFALIVPDARPLIYPFYFYHQVPCRRQMTNKTGSLLKQMTQADT